ncbi:MAG: family 78 glycoside hydrolase catalytic domain [bacterium]
MKHAVTLIITLLLTPLSVLHAAVAPIFITDMRTEGVSQPMGIEEAAPRFSWRYEASPKAPRGFRQQAFRIQVASSVEKLTQGQADLWDSGKQVGADTLAAIYAGKPLASATRYFWQVTGFDADGKTYSAKPKFFETGLLKAEDWGGAQWIGAKSERPNTLPANLQQLKDCTFETRFCILEGTAVVFFRASYYGDREYRIEIKPGSPGKLMVSRTGNKSELIKEYPLQNIAQGEWHSLVVTAKGGDFTFRVDTTLLCNEPLHDETIKQGSIAIGSLSLDKKKGRVQFDDVRLTVDGKPLVEESFDNAALFAFQEYFGSNNAYARVKDGALETCGVISYMEPKKGLEAPRFRKALASKSGQLRRARAYVSGLGYYKFWLNGKRMDDYELNPGFARYDKTAYYCVYDLTGQIKADNMLAFELGRGWYAMTTPTLWGETFHGDWMAEPALRVLVTLDYADGSRQTLVSDTSFKTAPGPILFDSIKAGEIYDARKEQAGWNTVGFIDKDWSSTVVANGKMPLSAPGLTAQLFEPIRAVERFPAVSITKVEDEKDAWQIDFGKNMAGTMEMKLKAKPGQEIRLSYVELPGHGGRERWNNFGAERTGSFQRDIYVAKGSGEEVYESSYCYKGFQYVRLEGLTEKPELGQFTAKAINSDMEMVGTFKTSSELWNKIWEAGRRCIQSNMHSIPTDCPQWEKLGWTCDDASPYYAMAFNYDLRKLYEKRLQDYADDISADGKIRNCVPGSWAKGEDPAWVGSYVQLVWKHYQTYGDRRVIERHFDNLKLYMSTLIKEGQSSEKPPLLTIPRKALGDWVSPNGANIPPEGALIYFDCYFYYYAGMMADLATLLGKKDDSAYYTGLKSDLKKAFNEYFFDEKEGCYYGTNKEVGFRQSPQAVPLGMGLVPADMAPRVTERLVQDIRVRKDHFWTGILGLEFIADALCENNRADVAYTIHLKDDYPSLGNMIRDGATTLWEAYSEKTTRSMNHKMFATPLGWMARYVAGLHVEGVLGEGPGFRKAVIAPYPVPEQIKFAQLDYDSPMGRYCSGWRMTDNGMKYDIVVPPNATALFRLPLLGKMNAIVSESGKVLWENGKPAEKVDGIAPPIQENDRLVFTVGSGSYSFQVKGN